MTIQESYYPELVIIPNGEELVLDNDPKVYNNKVVSGVYQPSTNTIYIMDGCDYESTLIHERIHFIQFIIYKMNKVGDREWRIMGRTMDTTLMEWITQDATELLQHGTTQLRNHKDLVVIHCLVGMYNLLFPY